MANIRKHFDGPSIVVIVLTLILFVAAVFAKGLTHDVLLEAGVFLVSVKLVLQTYKNSVAAKHLEARLEAIHTTLQGLTVPPRGEGLVREKASLKPVVAPPGFLDDHPGG